MLFQEEETQNAKALRQCLSTRNYSDPLGHLAVFVCSFGCQNLGQGFLLASSEQIPVVYRTVPYDKELSSPNIWSVMLMLRNPERLVGLDRSERKGELQNVRGNMRGKGSTSSVIEGQELQGLQQSSAMSLHMF